MGNKNAISWFWKYNLQNIVWQVKKIIHIWLGWLKLSIRPPLPQLKKFPTHTYMRLRAHIYTLQRMWRDRNVERKEEEEAKRWEEEEDTINNWQQKKYINNGTMRRYELSTTAPRHRIQTCSQSGLVWSKANLPGELGFLLLCCPLAWPDIDELLFVLQLESSKGTTEMVCTLGASLTGLWVLTWHSVASMLNVELRGATSGQVLPMRPCSLEASYIVDAQSLSGIDCSWLKCVVRSWWWQTGWLDGWSSWWLSSQRKSWARERADPGWCTCSLGWSLQVWHGGWWEWCGSFKWISVSVDLFSFKVQVCSIFCSAMQPFGKNNTEVLKKLINIRNDKKNKRPLLTYQYLIPNLSFLLLLILLVVHVSSTSIRIYS